MFRTDVSIFDPCTTDGSIRLRVVSVAPDSAEYAACRTFYRQCDAESANRDGYNRYDGWVPPQTADTIAFIMDK